MGNRIFLYTRPQPLLAWGYGLFLAGCRAAFGMLFRVVRTSARGCFVRLSPRLSFTESLIRLLKRHPGTLFMRE